MKTRDNIFERVWFGLIVYAAWFAAWVDEKIEKCRGPHTREPK